jgi:Domain of unknown function (DUF4349)
MKPAFIHRESPRRSRPTRSLIVLGALSALLLTGCGSGGTTATSSEGRASGGALAQDSAAAKSDTGTKNSAPEASKPGVVGVGPKLTKSASLDLRVKNIDAAAAQVRTIATGLQAQVLSEQIGTGGSDGPVPLQSKSDALSGFGTLTLSVPADKLDTALDQLARIGTVQQRNMSTQDVTAQYVDTESRLKTMRASVERVRVLMAQAKDIGQVVVLEGELSRREADLESLESQLSTLKNNVERSTLTVSLSTPGHESVSNTGFVAGLRSGWDAFTASARGLFTVIGAVLPFAVFFALVAAPLVWWLRRRRTGSAGDVSE